MNTELSSNTKAILLLTAPLVVGKSMSSVRPLNSTEYGKLAHCLRECGRQPADLLEHVVADVLRKCLPEFDNERIVQLLERGFLLSQAVDHWQTRALWVVSRADPGYPKQFKKRLGHFAPPVLYGCGEATLLEHGGLAVVGSRNVADGLMEYAEDIGRLAAKAQCSVISGGARGVDQAAIRGALAEGGTAVAVLSDGLERTAMDRGNRDALLDSRLVLISPYDPRASFNVGHAMQRNKMVYALGDAGLVVESDYNKGGTWAGAVEQLDKFRLVPIYARANGDISTGLRTLQRKGALEWPNPRTPDEFRQVLAGLPMSWTSVPPQQGTLSLNIDEDVIDSDSSKEVERVSSQYPAIQSTPADEMVPADALFAMVERLLRTINTPTTDREVAAFLGISKNQANDWLKRLEREGKYQRLNRPVRYERANANS